MPEDKNRISKILLIFYWVLLLVSCAVIVSIIITQYFWEPPTQSIENFTPKNEAVEVKPERGDIMDCNGKLLAISTPLYNVYMDCYVLKAEFDADKKEGKNKNEKWLAKSEI